MIDSNQLNVHRLAPTLFFLDGGVLYNEKTQSALLPLDETVSQLSLNVENAFFCSPSLVIQTNATLNDIAQNADYQILTIREFLTQSNAPEQQLMLRAYHWLNWDKVSRFCGQCGALLTPHFDRAEKKCKHCDHTFFPYFSPAVMVLIEHEGKLLLARSKHFRPLFYSALAGFLEVGETAEQAAHREVFEETGLKIKNLRYFSSQTWPFPNSFMIAFKAEYASGELSMDPLEIEDAKWFDPKELPLLPPSPSIARGLIDEVLKEITEKIT